MKRFLFLLAVATGLAFLLLKDKASVEAADWVHWRGPEQTGVSREVDLPDKWSPDPKAADSNLIWKQPFGCRSTPLVMNGRVYIFSTVGEEKDRNEQERVMCLDIDTGKVRWERRFNVFHTSIVSNRLGWTNLAGDSETGNIYAHGTQGLLFCFNKDGDILWQHSLTEEYGRVSGYGGRLCSPVVDGDLVIICTLNASWGNQARGATRAVAFDKRTGQVVWWYESPYQALNTFYSVPVVANINGQRVFISGGGDGYVHAMKVRTGEPLWTYHLCTNSVNGSPVVDGNKVYIAHGVENPDGPALQGRVVCLDAGKIENGKPALVWENRDGIMADFSSPLLHEGRLYICDDKGRMFCLDAATGKPAWKKPFKYGVAARGSPVWADGKIYVFEVNAKFHILKPGATDCEELHSQFFRNNAGPGFVETNGTPAVAGGRIYLATRDDIFCIGKKDHKAAPLPIQAPPAETPFAAGAAPALIQVVPCDVVLAPGEKVKFTVRALDANGRLLKTLEGAEWSLPTPPPPPKLKVAPPPLHGQVSKDGVLTVAAEKELQEGYVDVKAAGLTARVRVRVVPPLPIHVDLERVPEGQTPAGLVNCPSTKFAVVKLPDGTKALKKLGIDARPPFARANAYIGLPGMTGYTIQADLQGNEVRTNLPDGGIIANRYTLYLDGKLESDGKRRLRLISWEGPNRVDESAVFDWQPNVWYRLKLTVDVEKDKAVVRGKAWQADQKEPNWTIEFKDSTPNREGAPALYGYSTGIVKDSPGTEMLYRNIDVTPNRAAGGK